MAADCEFILLNGPAFAGKSHVCKVNFSKYHRISHTELFERNAELGLRDVGLSVTQLLKKGSYVIVDDSNALRSTRSSYINIVKRKIPNCKTGVLKIYPKHGLSQLLWAKEHWFTKYYQDADCLKAATRHQEIEKWFSKENTARISYIPRKIDNPEKDANVDVLDEYNLPLTVHSSFKLEVPVLLIDFEGIVEGEEEQCTLHPGIHKVLKLWYKSNPGGRIIILSKHSGELKSSEEGILIRCMKILVQKLQACPVYLIITDVSKRDRFSSPPDPEFLGFVQKRHTLDLQYKNSAILYASHNHMKMAESAGLQHIKSSKVLEQPSLVAGDVIGVKPVVPEFLTDLEYFCCNQSSPDNPQIPQYNNVNNFNDHFITEDLNCGRKEFLFSDDMDIIESYQQLYSKYATRIEESGSNLQGMIADQIADKDSEPLGSLSPSSACQRLTKSISSSRELPKWMLHQKDSKSSVESDSGKPVNKSSSLRGRQLVYVMTRQELVDMASEILKQAGRSDILHKETSKSLYPDSMDIVNSAAVGTEDAVDKVKEVKNRTETEGIVNPTCTLLNEIFESHKESGRRHSPRKKRRDNTYSDPKPGTSRMNLMEMDINSESRSEKNTEGLHKTVQENKKNEPQTSVAYKLDLSFLDDIF